jgi:hypothetical protein
VGSNPTPSAIAGFVGARDDRQGSWAFVRPKRSGTLDLLDASVLEDGRGVDRQQIRELLTLSPAERVDRLVRTVAVWDEILAHAGIPRPSR